LPFFPFPCYNTPMKKNLAIIFVLLFASGIFAQSTTWDELSEFEQYAIAFSSNLFQLNHEQHLDFAATSLSDSSKENYKKLLKDSWSITDHASLIKTYNDLVTDGGMSGSFKSLSALLDKYPQKTVLEIALEERLTILGTSRLYFVRDSREYLGFHDIEAWDLGRAITLMRYGIALGYISLEQAVSLCEPIVEKLKKDYTCWYDYIDHYVQGRGYYGLYDSDSNNLMSKAINADVEAHRYIPLDTLVFTGENADKQHSHTGYAYTISGMPDAKAWQSVQKLYAQKQNAQSLIKLCEFEKGEFKDYSGIFLEWHMDLLKDYGTYQELLDYIDSMSDYIETLSKEGSIYYNTLFRKLQALNNTCQPQRAIQIVYGLPEFLQYDAYILYQYGFANYLMISLCKTQTELEYYTSTAIQVFELLQENDVAMDDVITAWLERVR